MPDPALVSVIIATYNSARYLVAALESVAAQDYRPLEVIIVDDGSTDNTAVLVADFFNRTGLPGDYCYQPNQGPAIARNYGLGLAKGPWLTFLDADDLWLPTKTVRQLAVLTAHPEAGAAWGDGVEFEGDSLPGTLVAGATSTPHPMFLIQSMLFRRSVMEQIGPFNPTLRIAEDVDWLFRAMEQNVRFVLHRDLVVYYRRHAGSLTSERGMARRAFHAALRQAINRRRASGLPGENRPSPFIVLPPPQAAPESHITGENSLPLV